MRRKKRLRQEIPTAGIAHMRPELELPRQRRRRHLRLNRAPGIIWPPAPLRTSGRIRIHPPRNHTPARLPALRKLIITVTLYRLPTLHIQLPLIIHAQPLPTPPPAIGGIGAVPRTKRRLLLDQLLIQREIPPRIHAILRPP